MKRVSVRACNDYKYEQVKDTIRLVLNDIGGLENIIKRNSNVFRSR